MKITECIILSGGLGTRLKNTIADLPKGLAPVAGKPLLFYVIEHLQKQGVEKFIFALGYKHEMIEKFLKEYFFSKNAVPHYPLFNYQLSIEEYPLGTGGAIQMACSKTSAENILIVNGDTLFKISVAALSHFHLAQKADCTLALKPMKNFDRYAAVEIDSNAAVKSFHKKKFCQKGLINGGAYILNVPSFLQLQLPLQFSFEEDYLERYSSSKKIMAIIQDEYFIDIGVPEDLERAGREMDN